MGNASIDTRQTEKKGRKINSVKTKKTIDADIFSDIVALVPAMDSLAQPLSTYLRSLLTLGNIAMRVLAIYFLRVSFHSLM